LDFPKEEPQTLRQLFDIYRSDLHYSIEDLSKLLAIYPREIERIYPFHRTVEERRAHLKPV
jgi:hypothetical protein